MKKLDTTCACPPSTPLGVTEAPLSPSSSLPIFLLLLLLLPLKLFSQTLPPGYILQYKQDFTKPAALGDFWFSRDSLWQVTVMQGNGLLHADALPRDAPLDSARGDEGNSARGDEGQSYRAESRYAPIANRAVLKNRIFGDFVLEADVRLPESAGAQAAILLGIKDSTKYYFIRLSADSAIKPGIFLYKNGRVTALPLRISQPALLKPAVWQKVRVERNIVTRLMRVYVGNLSAPVMETKDYELIMGYIGFGAAEGAVRVDNVRVWAPTMLDESDK